MTTSVRYQVFLSSTYNDLREERQQATQAVLEAGFFPAGMELFPASDETQWELIKRVIEESDYYVVIVSGRYGSLGPEGMSFTEMEYDYAVSQGIPVLGFVRGNVGEVASERAEKTDKGRKKLESFREKVMSRTCRKFSTPMELGMAVLKSLMAEARVRPRTGWIRADQARSEDDIQRERTLSEKLDRASQQLESLKRELRDRAVLRDEVAVEELAQGDDPIDLRVIYTNASKAIVGEIVPLTYDEVLKIIGPSLYGYIQRKMHGKYEFENHIEENIRSKIIEKVQSRKITIEPGQIDACIIQFKELGILQYEEVKEGEADTFREVTLTEEGERHFTRLTAIRRKKPA